MGKPKKQSNINLQRLKGKLERGYNYFSKLKFQFQKN